MLSKNLTLTSSFFDSGMQKTLFNISLAGMKSVCLAHELPTWCVCIRGQACGGEEGKRLRGLFGETDACYIDVKHISIHLRKFRRVEDS